MQTLRAVGLYALLCAVNAAAQTTNLPVRAISLDECLRMALQHNLDLQIERRTSQIALFTLRSSYGTYDPVISLTAKETYDSYPSQDDPRKQNPYDAYSATTDTFAPALSGRLPMGLSYGLNAGSDFMQTSTELYPGALRATNDYTATAALTLKQPLLKNFWIDAERKNILVNKKNLKIAEQSLRQQLINLVTKVQVAYYELIFARERIKVQEQSLELTRELVKKNRQFLEVGKLAPLEELQSESQAETSLTDLIAAQQSFADQQNVLKGLIHDNFREWPDVVLDPAEILIAVPLAFNRTESWQMAISQRPDYNQMRLELEKSNLMVQYRRNQLFPSLDLVGSYGGRGVRDTFENAVADVSHVSYPAYGYGVVFSMPLSRQAERNNYKASQAAQEQGRLQLKKLEQEILVEVDNAGRLVQTAHQRINSTRQARVYAEAALSDEMKRLDVGRTTSFVVLQLQRTLTEARLSEIRALVDYNKALVQLAFSEGSTLLKNRLYLDIR
jgi:outer membrane protein